MLRRVLCPWNVDAIIEETVAWAREHRIDEIMWFPESSGMYKELLPLEEVEKRVANLRKAKEETEAAGILYSVNPLTTLGHGDYGGDGAAIHPGLELMVDYTGAQARFCSCPLSPVWRDLIRRTYELHAATEPVRLWVEDDYRYFNHKPNVSFGCYCDRHMAEFGKRIGRAITREELVAALLAPGTPGPLRAEWLRFLGQTLADTAAMLRDAVQAVSPNTQLGWMSSTPALHQVEGRHPRRQMQAFAGAGAAAIRMTTAGYITDSPLAISRWV